MSYETGKPIRTMKISGQDVEIYEPPTIYGPTDRIQFAEFAARVINHVKYGDMCSCGGDRLVNVVAEDDPDENGRKLIVVKCYSCNGMFMSEYPKGEEGQI